MEELEQPYVQGSNEKYGKFKDAESLVKAYTNLEAEFTKKSQRLASLENAEEERNLAKAKEDEVNQKVEEFVTKFEIARPFSSALKETLSKDETVPIETIAMGIIANNYKSAGDYATDDEFLNNYIYSNADIKDKIVKDYLSNLTQNSPIKVDMSATIPLTPPRIPTTIAEAGKIAKSIIKQK
jgi:predicted nuclease with TOPRIM domain